MIDEFKPELVNLIDVPARGSSKRVSFWRERFNTLPEGKAAVLKYNNRQRAHQVACSIRCAAKYCQIPLSTRIIHAEPEIHGTDGWLLYYWRRAP